MELDEWQKQVLKTKGNLCLCSGRQVGKSTVIAIKAGEFALKNPNKTIMIIASVERQALLLFEKVLSYIHGKNKSMIGTKKDKPTKHKLILKNGSVIHCLPTGESGYGIRGFTIDELYADEAAFIPEEVWAAVTPMLATTGGNINLLSTPFGTEGYFYRCFHDKKFTAIHVNTEEVAKERKDPQKTRMLEFLKDEKERMTKLQYQQEYLGLFVGGIMKFFSDETINKACTIKLTNKSTKMIGKRFMGVDVARFGGDETVLVSVDQVFKDKIKMIDLTIPDSQSLPDTARLILHKDRQINHKKIYIDTTGMGWGVYDPLKEHPQTRRKVIAFENLKKVIHKDKGKKEDTKKVTYKEDGYNNLRNLMETGKIELFDDARLRHSLRSIQYELTDKGIRIYGNYSHIAEALMRAAWCAKDKSLNIYIY